MIEGIRNKMNQQHSWKRTQDIEIDLADLFRRLCVRWKQAVICAAVFALILTGFGYFKNAGSTDSDGADTAQDIELEEEEQQKVTAAIQMYEEVRALEEYLEHSVLMQIDAYHKNRIAMLYCIEGAAYHNLQKILGSYMNYVTNGGMIDALAKADEKQWDIDKSYLAELVTAYQRTYTMPYQTMITDTAEKNFPLETLFYIEVTGKDERMARQLALDVRSELEKYVSDVKARAGHHKLTLISSEKSVTADNNLQIQQHDKRTLLTSSLSSLQAMTAAFHEEQMIVYKDAAGLEDTQEIADKKPSAGKSGFPKKYAVLGFIAGALLYCFLYVSLYLIKDTIKSIEEMRRLYLFPVYGDISPENGKMMQTLNRIRLSCKKRGIKKMCAATDFVCKEKEKECLEGIVQQLNGWGIDVFAAENACSDAAVWDTLAETGCVLLVCKTGTTTHRRIDEEMEFYTENGIETAGAVVFDV